MTALTTTGAVIWRARFTRTDFAGTFQTTAASCSDCYGFLASGCTAGFRFGLGSCHGGLQFATPRVTALPRTGATVRRAGFARTKFAGTIQLAAATRFCRGTPFHLSTRNRGGQQQRHSQQQRKRGEKLRHDSFPLKSNSTGMSNRAPMRDHSQQARFSGTGVNSRADSHKRGPGSGVHRDSTEIVRSC